MEQNAATPIDAREARLIDKVAEALATYHGEEPSERHRRMALALLRSVLRAASKRQPDVG